MAHAERVSTEVSCLHHRFAARVAADPSAPALSFEGREQTYGELDRRAEALARRLRAVGVGPEVRVGLCLPRSAEMVVAILAVLKAGGAYVPLDPDVPGRAPGLHARGRGVAVRARRRGEAAERAAGERRAAYASSTSGADASRRSRPSGAGGRRRRRPTPATWPT